MKRAVIYIRVSSERQAGEDRVAPEVQEQDCLELCQRLDLEPVEIIKDLTRYKIKGKLVEPSGTRSDRPGWQRLLSLLPDVDVLAAWDASRLFRGLRPAADLAEALEHNPSVEVALVRGSLDKTTLSIMAGVSSYERDAIRSRLKRARAASLEKGNLPGGDIPLGYIRTSSGPEIDPTGAAAVRWIFDLYANGRTHKAITETLSRSSYRPAKGNRWTVSSIRNVLNRWQFYGNGEQICSLNGESYIIKYPPLLDPDLFSRVQKRREYNRSNLGRRRGSGRHLLRGLVVCPCGWSMVVHNDKRWIHNSTYRCQRSDHALDVHPDCPVRIRVDRVDALVWKEVLNLLLHPNRLGELAQEQISSWTGQAEQLELDLKRAQVALSRAQKERDWILDQGQAQLLYYR